MADRFPIGRRTALAQMFAAGALLAGNAARAAAMTAAPPPQAPAKEGIAAVAGTRLEYWDTGGTGEAVVLLHPATGSMRIWSYQQPALVKAGYRVIAYSRRGYGKSDPVPKDNPGTAADDLRGLLAFLGVRKCHLVGSAAGGGVIADFALSYPEAVSSLVIACAVGGVEDKAYLDLAPRLKIAGFDALPAEIREVSSAYRAANPEGTKAWAALEHIAVTGNRFGQKPRNTITLAKLETLKSPTLVIGGDDDPYVSPAMLRMYAARLPNHELTIVPGAGHSLYWEQPEVFNRALLAFFAKHRA